MPQDIGPAGRGKFESRGGLGYVGDLAHDCILIEDLHYSVLEGTC